MAVRLRDKIAKEFTFYSMSFLWMQVINIAVAVYIRNALGPEQMGVWVALQVVLTYTKYSDLGLAGAASREIPYEKGKEHWDRVASIRNSSYTFTWFASAVLSGLMAAAVPFVYRKWGSLYAVSLGALAFLSFFQRVSTFCIAMARAERRFDFLNRFNVYSSLANAALVVLLVHFFKLFGYYSAMVLSFVFNYFYLVGFSGISFRWEWNWPMLKSLSKMGIILVFVNMTGTFFTSVDKLSITALIDVKTLGVYSIVMLASNMILMLPNNLSVIVFPYLNEAFGASEDPEGVKKFVLLPNQFIAAYLPLLIGLLCVVAPFLVRIFLPKYVEGIEALKIGLWGSLFLILSATMGNTLITFKKYGWMIPAQLLISAGMFASNVLLTRAGLGLEGIAATYLGGYLLLWAVYSAISLKTFATPGLFLGHAAWVLGSAAYVFFLLLALDRCVPQATGQALVFKLAVLALFSLPVLWINEKTFGTFRLLTRAMSFKQSAPGLTLAEKELSDCR